MSGEHKVTTAHLSRRAIVYLRQSSEGQVKNNLESQRLQYAMTDRARALGFTNIEVVDVDLGSSAAVASKRREGFERLLGAVALGEVGMVLSRELSRLSRTDRDFCQLVEVCQLFGTLLADEDSVYDAARTDDQLVLGIKATMSVVELNVLRQRLALGRESKARRGEIYPRLPPGYVWNAHTVVKDPNQRVQEAIGLIFAKFREVESIRQTFKWFRDNAVEAPVSKVIAGKINVVFRLPTHSFISDVLHNPFYAGAYAWGRRPVKPVWRNGMVRKRQGSALPAEEARVFIRDHHDGYIDWKMYEENQKMIERNNWRGQSDGGAGVARSGQGLFTGLLRCGRCGRKLYVRYWGKSGTSARYLCSGDYVTGGERYCIGVPGATVDRRIGDEIVRALSPLGVEASLLALKLADSRDAEQRAALQRKVEQLQYEAERAFEQYDRVDARNRLVAVELERRWNARLEELERAQAALVELDSHKRPLSIDDEAALLAFGARFADVWNHADLPRELRKRIVRAVVDEVVVSEGAPGTLSFVMHWKGGVHTSFEMARPNPKAAQKTSAADLDLIQKMAARYGDGVIANVLNRLGRRTGKGKRWTQAAVYTARRKYRIAGQRRSVDDPDVLTLQGAATYTGTSDTTIKKLVSAKVLPMHQVCPYAPWEIKRSDLDSTPVRTIVEHLKRTGRLILEGTSQSQPGLF